MGGKRAGDRDGKLIQGDSIDGELWPEMGGEVECFGNAPDARGMTVVPLPVPRGVRDYPMPVGLGEGGAVGVCTGCAGRSVAECDSMVGGGDGL